MFFVALCSLVLFDLCFILIVVVIHYSFLEGMAETISFIFVEAMRFFCFFFVCYFFCKKASNILPQRKAWLQILRLFLIFNMGWMFGSLLWLEIDYSVANKTEISLCRTFLFMFIRVGGEFITFAFFIIGIIITYKVKTL